MLPVLIPVGTFDLPAVTCCFTSRTVKMDPVWFVVSLLGSRYVGGTTRHRVRPGGDVLLPQRHERGFTLLTSSPP